MNPDRPTYVRRTRSFPYSLIVLAFMSDGRRVPMTALIDLMKRYAPMHVLVRRYWSNHEAQQRVKARQPKVTERKRTRKEADLDEMLRRGAVSTVWQAIKALKVRQATIVRDEAGMLWFQLPAPLDMTKRDGHYVVCRPNRRGWCGCSHPIVEQVMAMELVKEEVVVETVEAS